MEDTVRTLEILSKLKEKSLQITIDNFGAGYSYSNFHKRLPVDKIKIDQSLVSAISASPDARKLIQAIINFAKSQNLFVLAEGVETKQQLDFLRESRCDEAQGFFFSEPLPVGLCTLLLKENKTFL